MEEEFRNIPGHKDYQVSNLGTVKSLKFGKERVLKQSFDEKGYLLVCLRSNKKSYTKRVHVLVIMAFVGHVFDKNNDTVIDHINNNRIDNRLENLQLTTSRHNNTKDIDKNITTSKYIGVHWSNDRHKWCAKIYVKGKYKYLGRFTDEEDAHNAYETALRNL